MANNSYTFLQLKTAVTHALGGAPDVNVSTAEIVNGALSWLTGLHAWRWKSKAAVLTLIAAQNFVALPTDFDELVSVRKTGDATNRIAPASIDAIIEARQTGANASMTGLWFCLDWTPQTGVTLEPTPILQLYPTPSTSPGTLTLEYNRQIPKLSGDTDIPDVPSAYHELIKVACRAYALRIDGQMAGSDWELFNRMLPDYLDRDGRSAGFIGQYRGGVPRPSNGMRSNLGRNTQTIGA